MLLIRYYPKENEALTQYLMRLAYMNSHFKLSNFLKSIKMEKPKAGRFGLWHSVQLKNLAPALSKALNRDVTKVTALHQRHHQVTWLFEKGRTFAELVVDFPRICTACLVEDHVMDWRWSIATVARCPNHKLLLIDTCPQCHKPISWDANLFEFCPSCKKPWEIDASAKLFEEIELTSLERSLWPDVDGKLQANSTVLADITFATYVAARPFDMLIQAFSRVPYSAGHSELILTGMQLLTSAEHRTLWNERCVSHLQDFANTIHPPVQFNHWVKGTYDESDFLNLTSFNERPEYVQKARVEYASKTYDEIPRYHVDIFALAKAVNLDINDVTILFENKTFPMVNTSLIGNHKRMFTKIFNMHYITGLIGEFVKTPPYKDGYLTITAQTQSVTRHLCHYGDVVNAILTKKIKGYLCSTSDLSQVIVPVEPFKTWLVNMLKSACHRPIAVVDAAKAIDCSNDEIKLLVREGKLKWAKHQRKGEFLDGPSFMEYLKSPCRLLKQP
jgi:hypothetical protein